MTAQGDTIFCLVRDPEDNEWGVEGPMVVISTSDHGVLVGDPYEIEGLYEKQKYRRWVAWKDVFEELGSALGEQIERKWGAGGD